MDYRPESTVLPQRGSDLSRTTRSLRKEGLNRQWRLIDATGLVLGRLSTTVANHLRGKHLAQYTPHVDCGDCIVIINAEKVHLTGKKIEQKVYHRHTGYPGGIKATSVKEVLGGQHPERVIKKAVRRMLGDGSLAEERFRNLYVYAGPFHPHDGQQPRFLDVAQLNPKNQKVNTMSDSRSFEPKIEAIVERVVRKHTAPLEASDAKIIDQQRVLADEFRDNARRFDGNQESTNTAIAGLSDNQSETNVRLEKLSANQSETNVRLNKLESTLETIQRNTADASTLLEKILAQLAANSPSPK